jgi:hypothetical protein
MLATCRAPWFRVFSCCDIKQPALQHYLQPEHTHFDHHKDGPHHKLTKRHMPAAHKSKPCQQPQPQLLQTSMHLLPLSIRSHYPKLPSSHKMVTCAPISQHPKHKMSVLTVPVLCSSSCVHGTSLQA